jgi:hypothetical protein
MREKPPPSGKSDQPRPLNEEELESLLGLLRHWEERPFGRDEREEVVARVKSLVAEVRRLRPMEEKHHHSMRLAVREELLHPGPATPQRCRDCGEEIKPEVDRG